MSDENENGEEGFIDHIFNMFKHVDRAIKKKSAAKGDAPKKRKMRVIAFDEAPADPPAKECCTAKRGE